MCVPLTLAHPGPTPADPSYNILRHWRRVTPSHLVFSGAGSLCVLGVCAQVCGTARSRRQSGTKATDPASLPDEYLSCWEHVHVRHNRNHSRISMTSHSPASP
jgi:hypothetical protein